MDLEDKNHSTSGTGVTNPQSKTSSPSQDEHAALSAGNAPNKSSSESTDCNIKNTEQPETSKCPEDKVKSAEALSEKSAEKNTDKPTPECTLPNIKQSTTVVADKLMETSNASANDSLSPSTQSQTINTSPPQVAAETAGAAAVPDNILSPPKSETQTDETNTGTSSSSPNSDSQLSPIAIAELEAATPTAAVQQPINVVANGTIPKSGKPLMSALTKKLNKPTRTTRPRKQKGFVAMYESEISDNKIGIKLCIKKSDAVTATATTGTTTAAAAAAASTVSTPVTPKTAASKQNRKRSRKSKTRPRLDSDDSEYETKRKKERAPNNNATERQKKVSFSGVSNEESKDAVIEQSDWGAKLPEEVLYQIFQIVVNKEGCLPTLFRLGRVCSLWRRVSVSPTLWKSMDLSTYVKEKYRTELKLKWFVDNRCSSCTDLNVSNWKVSDINCFLTKLEKGCPNLVSITLSGWKGFTSDHLTLLVESMKKLERLDLSSVNVEMNASKSAVGLQSLCNALQTMNGRLTHLHLAHNRLAGIPQIVNILSTHCPNLVLLDLSNVTTQATSHAILHIEKLQSGCQKLRVLRVTNSHVTLSTATMQEMMDSPGFPDLEELSVAALTAESRVFGDEHLQRILKTSSKLKLLDVRGCTRLTHESLIRLPAWDIKHLFLSGCSVTRDVGSGLELIASKWAHSLIELDLAWANVQQPIDNALRALAEKGSDSPLGHVILVGSSVSEEAVKEILANCAHLSSINLSSCRGLPRGVKRLMQGPELQELRDVLKVQMKVKLPSQLKREQEEAAQAAQKNTAGSDGGGTGSQQSN